MKSRKYSNQVPRIRAVQQALRQNTSTNAAKNIPPKDDLNTLETLGHKSLSSGAHGILKAWPSSSQKKVTEKDEAV